MVRREASHSVRRGYLLASVALLATLVTLIRVEGASAEPSGISVAQSDSSAQALIDGHWVSVGIGDTIGRGVPNGNGLCHFDEPGIQVRDPEGQPSEPSSSNTFRVNEDCTVTITSITDGPGAQSPDVREAISAAIAEARQRTHRVHRAHHSGPVASSPARGKGKKKPKTRIGTVLVEGYDSTGLLEQMTITSITGRWNKQGNKVRLLIAPPGFHDDAVPSCWTRTNEADNYSPPGFATSIFHYHRTRWHGSACPNHADYAISARGEFDASSYIVDKACGMTSDAPAGWYYECHKSTSNG
jgi:hypothetical protein